MEDVSHIAPTQIGEFYLNFGVLGVIGGMCLLATLVRITQESLLRGPGTAPSLMAASAVLYLMTRKFQGSIALSYSMIVFTLAPILLTHLLFRFTGHVVDTRDANEADPALADRDPPPDDHRLTTLP